MGYSRDNPSPRYRELLEQYQALHRNGDPAKGIPAAEMFDGRSLPRQASRIRTLVAKTGAKQLLDYGCGKGSVYLAQRFTEGLQSWNGIRAYWGVDDVHRYDPGHEPFSKLPEGRFPGVICTDVLEHCPAEDMPWIVGELFGYAERFVFANVACYPAGKTLPNGENAHCTIKPLPFWQEIFESAAKARPGVLWEVWVDTTRGRPEQDARIANFEPAPAPMQSVPLWRLA
jgi:hypothetical protein